MLFAAAGEPSQTSRQANTTENSDRLSEQQRLAKQAEAKRTAEERKANAKLMAERRRKAQEREAADRVAAKEAGERRKQDEAVRKRREELEAAIARAGMVNLAAQYTGFRQLYGLSPADLKLITDSDPNTSWTFTVFRTDPKFIPKGKGFKLKWDELQTINKLVVRQLGDNLRSISIWYLHPETKNFRHFCGTQWSLDPKNPTQFVFLDTNRRLRRDHLLLFNGESLHDSPRSLGHSGNTGSVTIEAHFYQPIQTTEVMISLSAFDGRPVTIQDIEAY